MKQRIGVADVLVVIGLGALTYAAYLIYMPAGLAVGGFCTVGLGVFLASRGL